MNKYFYKCKHFRPLMWKFSANKSSNEKGKKGDEIKSEKKKCSEQMTD